MTLTLSSPTRLFLHTGMSTSRFNWRIKAAERETDEGWGQCVVFNISGARAAHGDGRTYGRHRSSVADGWRVSRFQQQNASVTGSAPAAAAAAMSRLVSSSAPITHRFTLILEPDTFTLYSLPSDFNSRWWRTQTLQDGATGANCLQRTSSRPTEFITGKFHQNTCTTFSVITHTRSLG